MKRLRAVLPVLALALLLPAAALASDLRPIPPVPSTRDNQARAAKAGQPRGQTVGQSLSPNGTLRTGAKTGQIVKGANGSTLTVPTKPPASLQ